MALTKVKYLPNKFCSSGHFQRLGTEMEREFNVTLGWERDDSITVIGPRSDCLRFVSSYLGREYTSIKELNRDYLVT